MEIEAEGGLHLRGAKYPTAEYGNPVTALNDHSKTGHARRRPAPHETLYNLIPVAQMATRMGFEHDKGML